MVRGYAIVGALLVLFLAGLQVRPLGQAPPAAARVTIVGSVVDGTLTPVAGATVLLEQNGRTSAQSTTDAAGKFRFADIAAGAYRVRATKPGFTAFSRDIQVPAGVQTLQLPIVMTRPEDAITKSREE